MRGMPLKLQTRCREVARQVLRQMTDDYLNRDQKGVYEMTK